MAVVLSHPEWWIDHPDELADALRIAAQAPERDQAVETTADEVRIEDPGWWADHVDELVDGLGRVETFREREAQDRDDTAAKPRQQWGDIDAMIARRAERIDADRSVDLPERTQPAQREDLPLEPDALRHEHAPQPPPEPDRNPDWEIGP
jgi:hypothetical protein